jgi:hypothetical protein
MDDEWWVCGWEGGVWMIPQRFDSHLDLAQAGKKNHNVTLGKFLEGVDHGGDSPPAF